MEEIGGPVKEQTVGHRRRRYSNTREADGGQVMERWDVARKN